jgi:5-methylcytosine-specific restriction endonuclease McrA
MPRPREVRFTRTVQAAALARQKYRCACCGETIAGLGEAGRAAHRFGEIAQAHHMRHASAGGTGAVDNCVILCQSCHYSAHEGGNYRYGSVRDTAAADYPHFNG